MKQILLTIALWAGLFLAGVQAQVTLLNENFEGNAIPLGWTTIDADGDGQQWEHSGVQDVFSQCHSGSGAAASYSKDINTFTALTPDNWLVTPAITLAGNSTLSFWRMVGYFSYAEHYGVYISTTSATDPSAFTLLYEETPTAASYAWTERTVSLSAYTGSTVYLAFRHFNSTNLLGIAIDDILVTCDNAGPIITTNPTILQFPNVPVGQSSASQQVTVESFFTTGATTATVTAPFEISLNDYDFLSSVTLPFANQTLYVRYSPTVVGSDSAVMTIANGSVTADVLLFGNSIDCGSFTLPYAENFNNLMESTLPNCWSAINPVNGCPSVTNNYSVDNVLKFEGDYINFQPVYAVLPLMPDDLSDLQVSFTTFRESYGSGTFSVGYMSDPYDSSTFVPVWSVNSSQINASEHYPFLVSFENVSIDPSENYYIAFRYVSIQNTTWLLDDVVVETIPDCAPPYNLSVSVVTGTTATVHWNGNASLFNLYYKQANDSIWTEMTDVSIDPLGYTIENLLPVTNYVWYVASVCDDDTLVNSLAISSFTTPCSTHNTPFQEDFDASASLPACWGRYNGWAGNIFAGEQLVSTSSGWNFNNTMAFGANHARVNIYGSSCNRWLVTPAIDLSGLTDPVLVFDLALTDFDNASPIEDTTAQGDDKFMVIVSTDYGATWSAANATVWSNDSTGDYVFNQIPATGQEVTIPLSDYLNETVMIAFYVESTVAGNGDNDLHIDNVAVAFATNCIKPTGLALQDLTDNSVTLSWTENGSASAWRIEYGPAGFQHGSPGATIVTANTNPFTVSGLEVMTYDFYVQSDCGNEVSYWSNVITATPSTFNMGVTGSDTMTTCSLIICDNGGPSGDYSSNCDYTLVLYSEHVGESVGVLGTYNTEANYDKISVYDGVGTDGTLLGEFSGNGILPVLVSSSGPLTIHFESDNIIQNSGFVLNTFCSSCIPPIGLAVSNVGPHSANLSWGGSADNYLLEYKVVGDTSWIQVTTMDTLFSLVGLVESTTYLVRVYSNCAGELSLAASITFTTTMEPATIPYFTDFSAGSDRNWLLNNANCTNHWQVGSVDASTSGLFITNNGTTAGYNAGLRSIVSAEKLFLVGDASELNISFDVKIGGESEFDYLKVFFAPSDVSYPATNSTTYPDYSTISYSTNAIDFSDFLQYSFFTSYPYKFNLTGDSVVHVTLNMPNPNLPQTSDSLAKLVFLWKNDNNGGTQPGAIIYNVSMEEVSCLAPSGLTVSNLTTSSADVSWTVNGDETSWTVQYKEADASSWISVPVSGTPSYALTNLNFGTSYQLRVRANCGVDDNSLWVSTEFATFCDAITSFPYTEGFESGSMPDCWSQEHVIGLANWTFQAGDHPNDSLDEAHSGSYNAYLFENSTVGNTARLVSPIFDLSHLSDPYLTYWFAQAAWVSNQDHLTVFYRTSPSSEWLMLLPHSASVTIWTMDSIALPNPTATYQIAFVGEAVNGYGIVLDDITVNGTPVVVEPCEVPTNLQQTVYTKEAGGIILSWTDNAGASKWNLQYRPLNGEWISVLVTGTPNYSITGLVNGNVYEARVQAICDDGVVSDWSTILTATATNSGIENWLENSVALFPNPANEVVNVQCTMNNAPLDGELHLFDVYGKLLQIVPITAETTQINVSGLANGIYFVRVTTEAGSVTKTFVKK